MFDALTSSLSPLHWIIGIAILIALAVFAMHWRSKQNVTPPATPESNVTLTTKSTDEAEKLRGKADAPLSSEDLLSTYPPFNRRGGGMRIVKHERRKNHTLFDEADPHAAAILGALSALSALVDSLAKERRKELTERNNERFSVALDYLIDFEQLLERDPLPNLLALSKPQEKEAPSVPTALLELSARKADPETLQHEFLKLSQSMLPLIKSETPNVSMLTVIERLNAKLKNHEPEKIEDNDEDLPRYKETDESVFL